MDNTHSILLEETRSNFFQLESLSSSLDVKAFGLATIDALLFSMFTYIFTLFKAIPLILYTPSLLLTISLIFSISCVCPQNWYRQSGSATLNKYETWESEDVARQLAKNYTASESELFEKYMEKFGFFQKGLKLSILAFALEIVIFLISYH
jgi:hypothetical protein